MTDKTMQSVINKNVFSHMEKNLIQRLTSAHYLIV